MTRALQILLSATALATLAVPAQAGSHLWRFIEFFSSSDGRIQFIELKEIGGSNSETGISARWFATDGYNTDPNNRVLLGRNLAFGTANKRFLIGTESYAALPAVPAPDYIFPDGFFSPISDTILWWFYDTFEVEPCMIPTDGLHSLSRNENLIGLFVGVNSPTNYAGQTASLDLTNGSVLCPLYALDTDGDGICDLGDTCPFIADPFQEDSGSACNFPDGLTDGIGDRCQCGDVNDDGNVDPNDVARFRDALAGVLGGVALGKCNVIGEPGGSSELGGELNGFCAIDDLAVIRRSLEGLRPGIEPACLDALP